MFVTGIDDLPSPRADIVTVAFDGAGSRLWVAEYAGPQTQYDYADEIAVSPDGSLVVVVGGQDLTFPNGGDAVAIAYDSVTGDRRWVTTFDGGHGYDQATDVTFAPDGSTMYLSVISKGAGDDLDWDHAVLALDPEDGHERWATRNSSTPSGGYDYALAVAASPDGAMVAATGWMEVPGMVLGYGTTAYDADTGATRWVRTHVSGPPTSSSGYDVAFSPDSGSVYATGISNRPLPEGRQQGGWVTASYDSSSGAELWKDRSEDGCEPWCDIRTLAVDPSGRRVYVGGSGGDFVAIAYDAEDGVRAWTARYDKGGTEMLAKVALSPSGSRLYLSGITQYPRAAPSMLPNPLPTFYFYNETTIAAVDAETGRLVWDAKPVFEESEDDLYEYWLDVRTTIEWINISTAPGRLYVTNLLTRRSLSKVCCPVIRSLDSLDTRFVAIALDDDDGTR